MNRDLLAAAAPQWIALEQASLQVRSGVLSKWVAAIMDAIELDHLEPDTWEALYLTYAIHALVEGRHYAALTFSEMALIDPAVHRPPRLLPDGPKPVQLADLRHAMELLQRQGTQSPGTRGWAKPT